MLIDGFTVVAQIINFLILLWLLRRFLYRPIIQAMSEREAKIAAQLAEAETLRQQAVDEAESYRQQRRELENHRYSLLSAAKEEVETWRRDSISKVREEIEEARTSWQRGVLAEQQAFIQDVRRRVGLQVCAVSRRALTDLADAELEQQVIEVFMRRFQAMNADEREPLRDSARRDNAIMLRTAFEISPASRQRLLQMIQQTVGGNTEVAFEVAPDLLCGIEMSSQDYRLTWALDDYLAALEANLLESVDERTEREHVS